jgi:hypothetical protein
MKHPATKKKIIAPLLIVLFISGSLSATTFPQPAHALVPVIVTSTLPTDLNFIQSSITAVSTFAEKVKGYSLDPIAWAVSKAVLQAVVKSTINWINSGFHGSPAFVTNLQQKLLDVGDAQAHQFLSQLSTNLKIKSPFQGQVASAIGKAYFMATNKNAYFVEYPYTLDQDTPDSASFVRGDFTKGGLGAFFSQIRNPQNSAIGAAELARQALLSQVATQQSTLKADYQAGNGFISWRGSCGATGSATSGSGTGKSCSTDGDCAGSLACIAGKCAIDSSLDQPTSLSTADNCLAYNVETPGSVLHDATTKAFGSGIDTLVSAHTWNEVVNAVLAQMISHIASSVGLTGLTQSSASYGGGTYFDQTDPTQTTTNTSLNGDLTKIIADQISANKNFKNEWYTINAAALSAQTALTTSTCSPNAQATMASTVQPVIDQSTAAMSQADTAIAALNAILTPLTASGGDATKKLSDASNAYAKLLSSGTIPTQSDTAISNAQIESSTDPKADGSPSLVTQMNQIAQTAQTCTPPH